MTVLWETVIVVFGKHSTAKYKKKHCRNSAMLYVS